MTMMMMMIMMMIIMKMMMMNKKKKKINKRSGIHMRWGGEVVGVDYPGQPPRYEWADGQDKVHFSCRACNKLYALEDTTEDSPPAKAPKGFKVQGFEVMLYGTCPECE